MKFSLWMIEEALSEYQIERDLNEEVCRTIENIRLYPGGSVLQPHILYIEKSDLFFHDGDLSVVCVHGNNALRIRAASVNVIFNQILQYFEDKQKWEEDINRMITSNCLLKDILNEFSAVLPLPLMVLDNGQMLLATSENYGLGSLDPEWDNALKTGRFRNEIITSYNERYQSRITLKGDYEVPANPFPFPSYNRNIFIDNEFVGFISMIQVRRIKEVQKDWFQIACQAVLSWITLYMRQNEIMLRQEAFEELLTGDLSHLQKFSDAMRTVGWKETDEKMILVLHCISDVVNANQHIAKVLNHASTALYAIEYQNDIAILANQTLLSSAAFEEQIVPILQKSSYYGGRGDSFTTLGDLSQYYMQARVALVNGGPLPGTIHHIRSHMVPYIFKVLREENDMDLRHPCLAFLKSYDASHHTNLYEVLKVYLQCSCNQTAAAEKLFMHRNSLIRKIERIERLYPVELGNPEVRLHLMMSYELDKTI